MADASRDRRQFAKVKGTFSTSCGTAATSRGTSSGMSPTVLRTPAHCGQPLPDWNVAFGPLNVISD